MRIFRASWFYTRLLLANLQFLSWFFWRQYFKTQVMGVGIAWLLLACILAGRQLILWRAPNTVINPSFSTLTQDHQVSWRLVTPAQASELCHQLEAVQALQPTHRDILVNLSFCRTLENNLTESKALWQTAIQLDHNALIFTSQPVFVPKN